MAQLSSKTPRGHSSYSIAHRSAWKKYGLSVQRRYLIVAIDRDGTKWQYHKRPGREFNIDSLSGETLGPETPLAAFAEETASGDPNDPASNREFVWVDNRVYSLSSLNAWHANAAKTPAAPAAVPGSYDGDKWYFLDSRDVAADRPPAPAVNDYGYWDKTGRYQREWNALHKKLVPFGGKAETDDGNLMRFANFAYYRHFNDGDSIGTTVYGSNVFGGSNYDALADLSAADRKWLLEWLDMCDPRAARAAAEKRNKNRKNARLRNAGASDDSDGDGDGDGDDGDSDDYGDSDSDDDSDESHSSGDTGKDDEWHMSAYERRDLTDAEYDALIDAVYLRIAARSPDVLKEALAEYDAHKERKKRERETVPDEEDGRSPKRAGCRACALAARFACVEH